jgi:superfamily II DNA or RNA helicase
VVFAVGIEHSTKLVEKFRAEGVRAAHLDGTTPEEEREQILLDLELGKIQLVSNVGVLCEGWDQPSVKCCVMARPTLSITLWMQCAGRILRPWGELPPVVLDHSGNVDRHGLPHEDRTWSLDGVAKRTSGVRYVTCAGCYAYVEKMPCPLCGYASEREPRKVTHADGVLERVDANIAKEKQKASEDPKRVFFDAQAEKARKAGFKPGYAAAKYKEKFGDQWPPWAWSQALKKEYESDTHWQERVEKRAREREFWQDRQKAADDLRASAPQPEIAEDGHPVEDRNDDIPF